MAEHLDQCFPVWGPYPGGGAIQKWTVPEFNMYVLHSGHRSFRKSWLGHGTKKCWETLI